MRTLVFLEEFEKTYLNLVDGRKIHLVHEIEVEDEALANKILHNTLFQIRREYGVYIGSTRSIFNFMSVPKRFTKIINKMMNENDERVNKRVRQGHGCYTKSWEYPNEIIKRKEKERKDPSFNFMFPHPEEERSFRRASQWYRNTDYLYEFMNSFSSSGLGKIVRIFPKERIYVEVKTEYTGWGRWRRKVERYYLCPFSLFPVKKLASFACPNYLRYKHKENLLANYKVTRPTQESKLPEWF